jgi:hypothetical protein
MLDRLDAPRAARRVVASECARAATGPECADRAGLMTSEVVTSPCCTARERSRSRWMPARCCSGSRWATAAPAHRPVRRGGPRGGRQGDGHRRRARVGLGRHRRSPWQDRLVRGPRPPLDHDATGPVASRSSSKKRAAARAEGSACSVRQGRTSGLSAEQARGNPRPPRRPRRGTAADRPRSSSLRPERRTRCWERS